MNVLFFLSEVLSESEGISKKILAQINALRQHGMNVGLTYLTANSRKEFTNRYIDDKVIDNYTGFAAKYQWRYKYKNLLKYIKQQNVKLVFIRYTHFANPFFISFLKKLKKNHVTVLLEIPTYPYDQEPQQIDIASKILSLMEKLSRRRFEDYITRIVTLSDDTSIFNVPTIQISNGINADAIRIVQPKRTNNSEIHLVGVSSMAYWHGYDRVIEGLKNYYARAKASDKRVFFHIIGDKAKAEGLRYKDLIKKYNLSEYVILHGKKAGEELDIVFDMADIGVGCLGCHRKGMNYSKSLKNREYCARGIPFFYSELDHDFEGENFVFKVPATDEPIDIEKIVDFITNDNFDPAKIRDYALRKLTWNKQFEKILQEAIPGFIPDTQPSSNSVNFDYFIRI